MIQQPHNIGDTSEVKKVMGSKFEIVVTGIGRKIKTYEKVKRYLAQKAGIEENELTVVRFRARSGTKKGVCVLIAIEKVADMIERIQFRNWEVKLFKMKSSMQGQLVECSGSKFEKSPIGGSEQSPIGGSEQSPIYVTITYSVATLRSPPSADLLQTKLEDKFKKSKKVNYRVVWVLKEKRSSRMSSEQLIVELKKGENNPGPNVDDFNDIIFHIRSTFQEAFKKKFSVHYTTDCQIPQIGGTKGDISASAKYPFFSH